MEKVPVAIPKPEPDDGKRKRSGVRRYAFHGSLFTLLAILAGFFFPALYLSPKRWTYEGYVAYKVNVPRDRLRDLQRRTGDSYDALAQVPQDKLDELAIERRYYDLPLARAQFRNWQERSEDGDIPVSGILSTRALVSSLIDRIRSGSKCTVAQLPLNCSRGATAGLNPNHTGWTFLGPSEVGGRTRSILFNPRNDNELWLGSVAGGVWHSVKGFSELKPANDLMANLVISSLVLDPSHPGTAYAGTGEGFGNDDSLRGAGILRTLDGETWVPIPETVPCSDKKLPCKDDSPFLFVNRLALSPDGGTLLAATWRGIYRSQDKARAVWTKVLPDNTSDINISDIKFHPTDNQLAIAGGMNTGEAYYSTDNGAHWSKAAHQGSSWIHVWPKGNQSPSRVEVVFAAADAQTNGNPKPSHIVYVSVDNNSGEIWRSQDDGKSFEDMKSATDDGFQTNYLGDQGWYGNSVWAGDPHKPDLVVVGGTNVWKSTDGGHTFTQITDWQQDGSPHADHHAIVTGPGFDGDTHRSVFVGNDGGVYKADDIMTAGTDKERKNGWTKLDHDYGVTQFYGIAWNKTSKELIAGAQDNGTLELAAGGSKDSWKEEYPGDGGACAADDSSSYVYGEYVYVALQRSSGPGQKGELIDGSYLDKDKNIAWKNDARLIIQDSKGQTANFIAPFVLDPNSSGTTILAGGASLWRTDEAKKALGINDGPQWRPIKQPVPGWDNPNYPNYISAVAMVPGLKNVAWVGYNNGDIYFTEHADQPNPTWTKIPNPTTKALRRPSRMVTRIVADSKDPKVMFVTYGGYSQSQARDNVWRTKDGGHNWANISGTLPAAPVFAFTINPQNSRFVYVGNVFGIFASEDGGEHWSLSNEGPTNTAVDDFVWIGNRLVAATHGRGAWAIDL